MKLITKQVSSLEKIRTGDIAGAAEVHHATVLRGESFSYQIAMESTDNAVTRLTLESSLAQYIKIYSVKNVPADFPVYSDADDDYIIKEPGLVPDLLLPLRKDDATVRTTGAASTVWITVTVPEELPAGQYPVKIHILSSIGAETAEAEQVMVLDVLNAVLPAQKTIFTQWFHVDCIADIHNVPIYSEEHWALIDQYMALASELGINMILTPVITPPLDTAVGSTRPCTQLVKIVKTDDTYSFDFSQLERWIDLCEKNHMRYFEISHLFSQWGLEFSPNIKVTENGVESYLFGWHVKARSEEYAHFLKQFVPELVAFLRKKGIKDRCWFHMSDEPTAAHLDAYRYAHDLVVPMLDGCPTMDALSDYDFYEMGLIEHPVTAINHMERFLKNKVDHQWAYYCCVQYQKVGNRFLAMPSYRNRILGLQMYKFKIEGFLQWGYNFYYSQLSRELINPYVTTSAEKAFPSGDPFSVYPVRDGVVPSLRAVIFREALNDVEVCRKLEQYIGREKVIAMIDSRAGMDLSFTEYPRNNDFVPGLMEQMKAQIRAFE